MFLLIDDLDEEDMEHIKKEIEHIMDDEFFENLWKFFQLDFMEQLENSVYEQLSHLFEEMDAENDEMFRNLITEIIEEILKEHNIPPRQCYCAVGDEKDDENDDIIEYNGEIGVNSSIKMSLDYLHSLKYPPQRSPEWYESRNNLFSASNIVKLFNSQAQQNSIIYEKCKNYIPPVTDGSKRIILHDDRDHGPSFSTNSCAHGIAYEPLSLLIYGDKHPTREIRSDYGCVQHPIYPFIGASPDAIDISRGQLIEVKNIVNREIDGIPKPEYWVQMQIQMEVCNLPACDFLETRFKTTTSDEFYTMDVDYKGIILLFCPIETGQKSKYIYLPLYVRTDKQSIDSWTSDMVKQNQDFVLFETQYWYLHEYSCVLVKRNHAWFQSVLPIIEKAWKVVEHERVHGFAHRAPVPRTKRSVCHIYEEQN